MRYLLLIKATTETAAKVFAHTRGYTTLSSKSAPHGNWLLNVKEQEHYASLYDWLAESVQAPFPEGSLIYFKQDEPEGIVGPDYKISSPPARRGIKVTGLDGLEAARSSNLPRWIR